MGFGICRARNLKMGDISSTDTHNFRLYESEYDYPPNIDPKELSTGRYVRENEPDYFYKGETSLLEEVQYRLDKNNVKGIRKNSNVAIEYVLAVSAENNPWENYSPGTFFQDATDWIEKRHGKNSVVAVSEHYDESNPHVHIVVVPLVTKEVKWKNKNGSGSRIETRTNVRAFTGGRELLRKLQDDYHQFCKKYERKMGVTFTRGTLVENQTKEYVRQTNHNIGRVRRLIKDFSVEFPNLMESVRKSIKNKLKALKTHLLTLETKNEVYEAVLEQEISKKRDKSSNNQWKTRGPQPHLAVDLNTPKKKAKQDFKSAEKRKAKKNKGFGM